MTPEGFVTLVARMRTFQQRFHAGEKRFLPDAKRTERAVDKALEERVESVLFRADGEPSIDSDFGVCLGAVRKWEGPYLGSLLEEQAIKLIETRPTFAAMLMIASEWIDQVEAQRAELHRLRNQVNDLQLALEVARATAPTGPGVPADA